MALPTGAISMDQVNLEIHRPSTQQLTMDDPDVRSLASAGGTGVGGSGTVVSMDNLRGKARVSIVISSDNIGPYNLYSEAAANANYRAGNTHVVLTINPTVSLGTLVITSAFNATDVITVNNNGRIAGRGGNGGNGGSSIGFGGTPGSPGETALIVQRPVTIFNNNLIVGGAGGGGGGSGSTIFVSRPPRNGGPQSIPQIGGGGGGGAGVNVGFGASVNGQPGSDFVTGGAGGSTFSPASPGGAGGSITPTSVQTGVAGTPNPFGPTFGGAGGAAGAAVTGNAFITWGAFGTRLGTIS